MHFADQTDLFSVRRDPRCARAELGTCPGPCAARCSATEYADKVREVVHFLDGKTDAPLDRLRARMEGATATREFELAARLRDREERIRSLRNEVVLFRDFLAGLSFVYRVSSGPAGPDRGYMISAGRVLFSFSFTFGANPPTALRNQIRSVLSHPMPPPEALDVQTREEIFLVTRWFRWKPEERERTVSFEEFLSG